MTEKEMALYICCEALILIIAVMAVLFRRR